MSLDSSLGRTEAMIRASRDPGGKTFCSPVGATAKWAAPTRRVVQGLATTHTGYPGIRRVVNVVSYPSINAFPSTCCSVQRDLESPRDADSVSVQSSRGQSAGRLDATSCAVPPFGAGALAGREDEIPATTIWRCILGRWRQLLLLRYSRARRPAIGVWEIIVGRTNRCHGAV